MLKQGQLQKYYPSIHKELTKKKFDFVLESTKKKLRKRGKTRNI
jgi:hypothetical protein